MQSAECRVQSAVQFNLGSQSVEYDRDFMESTILQHSAIFQKLLAEPEVSEENFEAKVVAGKAAASASEPSSSAGGLFCFAF